MLQNRTASKVLGNKKANKTENIADIVFLRGRGEGGGEGLKSLITLDKPQNFAICVAIVKNSIQMDGRMSYGSGELAFRCLIF